MEHLRPKRFLLALKGMGIDSYFFDDGHAVDLRLLKRAADHCVKCSLAATRKHVVFGEGDLKARLLFIGEAPGEEEDIQGRPFVGRAGRLLDQMIERIGFSRQEVYICNVLKCRPPGNRDPEQTEIMACKDYLLAQIDAVAPRIICTLGRHAYNTLMDADERITHIRGHMTRFKGTRVMPTYHPSFLLRNEGRVKEAWDDMERLRHLLKDA